MNKALAGVTLISGPIVAIFGAGISSRANNAASTPDTDWYYSCINGVGIGVVLLGLGMFFIGAMVFARKR